MLEDSSTLNARDLEPALAAVHEQCGDADFAAIDQGIAELIDPLAGIGEVASHLERFFPWNLI